MKIRRELFLIIAIAAALTVVPTFTNWQTHGALRYTPQNGDYFNYTETINLTPVGSYGYTENSLTLGGERMKTVYGNGTVAAYYGYTYTWSSNSVAQQPGGKSGNFSYSWRTLSTLKEQIIRQDTKTARSGSTLTTQFRPAGHLLFLAQ